MKDPVTGVPLDSSDALACPRCGQHPPLRISAALQQVLIALAGREPDAAVFSIECNKLRTRRKRRVRCGCRYVVRLESFGEAEPHEPTIEEMLAHEKQMMASLDMLRIRLAEKQRTEGHKSNLIVVPGGEQ